MTGLKNIKNLGVFLRSVDIFSSLSDEGIIMISGFLSDREIKSGDILFNEGDSGSELYIIKSGSVSLSIGISEGQRREVALFKTGEFFGEMSIFEHAPRSATCTAVEDSVLITMNGDEFFRIIEESPEQAIKIIYRMMNIIAQRLKLTSSFLTDMVHWGESARKRAITDEFTGAYNRRFLEDTIDQYFDDAKRSGKPLSLAMIDLDYFRLINEAYSHEMGDKVILEVVKAFNKHLTSADILARYGGDEFILLMPGRSLADAWILCESVRLEVERITILNDLEGEVKKVSTSLGLSSFPECVGSLKELREAADRGLYLAKEKGRNRVETPESLRN